MLQAAGLRGEIASGDADRTVFATDNPVYRIPPSTRATSTDGMR
jgi:hypothetical protein